MWNEALCGLSDIRIRLFYSIWCVHSMKTRTFTLHAASLQKRGAAVACPAIPQEHQAKFSVGRTRARAGGGGSCRVWAVQDVIANNCLVAAQIASMGHDVHFNLVLSKLKIPVFCSFILEWRVTNHILHRIKRRRVQDQFIISSA